MFLGENDLAVYLLLLGLGTALFTGILTRVAAWRYGRTRAIAVPIMALVAVGILMWRSAQEGGAAALDVAGFAMIFAGPAVAGGLLALVLTGRGKG